MAISGFKGFGWILGLATVAPACYMVSSMVAAERARVEAVERAIVQARRDIRALETEFDTRSNFAQLERWNGEVLALAAPRPEQFVDNDRALAQLNMPADGMQLASLVVPSAPAEPAVVAAQPANPVAAAPAPVVVRNPTVAAAAPAPVAAALHVAAPVKPRPQRVAMLDGSLLRELASEAQRERSRNR